MKSEIKKKHKTAKIDEGDISEQRRVEEQLRVASLYARSLIEASFDPLVTISPEGKITDVNKATESVTGFSREELIGSDISDYFTEPEKAREGYQEVFEKGFVKDYPLAIRHTSGKVTDVLYNATVYKNEAGEVQGVFATARDITERNRAEEALRESEEKFRKIAASARDAIIILDNDGNASYWNEAAEKMLGYSFEEVSGKDIHILLGPKRYHEAYKKGYAKFGTKGQGPVIAKTLELWAVRKDGTEIPIELSVSAFMMKGKWNALGIIRDVTERKRAEEQLRKARDELEIRVQERTAELTKAMELLKEQQKAFMKVSVPVVKVWSRILLVPLIGIFDSARAQLVMETLLTEIENTQAEVVILDVSGIPIVDSLMAKHLIRTVSAAKLMGAECIITGIRPKISQTIVQLGIDLSGITTRTTLADGLKVAFDLTNQKSQK